jgi:hypothetical protein
MACRLIAENEHYLPESLKEQTSFAQFAVAKRIISESSRVYPMKGFAEKLSGIACLR